MHNCWTRAASQLFGLSLGAIAIAGCNGNNQKIAEQIQQDIVSNGGTSLKSVICPNGIAPEAEQSFECVGKVENGYTFTIPVQSKDDKGTLTWDVPHAKGLLNIPKLEGVIQENLTAEIGTKPTVTCGGIYKALKPGEGFECQLSYKKLKPTPKPAKPTKGKPTQPPKPIKVTQTEKVNVTTDDSGNISWQRILPKVAVKPKTASVN